MPQRDSDRRQALLALRPARIANFIGSTTEPATLFAGFWFKASESKTNPELTEEYEFLSPLFSDDSIFRNCLGSPVPTATSTLKERSTRGTLAERCPPFPQGGEGHALKNPVARYPFEAKNMHVTGTVVLRILISKTGDIKDMLLVEGDRRLVPACVNSVKRWKYKPFLRNGEPVEVDMTTECHFEMSGG